ncbi:TetR/AcrR family transcriptional regulator [Microbispora sp. NPDC049125]|uniref:TetR/AcrR family transcriptional regulator n=1 Tax=Microbispora sp. NPDC049125 TaxID=3154929 RepID=UPI003465CB1F
MVISQRAALVADAAIGILAGRGMRGLTHRAVDEAAGLPAGSTSNHARTRAALLELALVRLAQLEEAALSAVLSGAPAGEPPVAPSEPPVVPPVVPSGAAVAPSGRSESLAGLAGLAGMLARATHAALTEHRRSTIARYELALEAARRPELRKVYDEMGRRFREPAAALLAAAGSPDPVRHGRQLVAYAEGLLFDAVVGAGETPSLEDLHTAFREFLQPFLPSSG